MRSILALSLAAICVLPAKAQRDTSCAVLIDQPYVRTSTGTCKVLPLEEQKLNRERDRTRWEGTTSVLVLVTDPSIRFVIHPSDPGLMSSATLFKLDVGKDSRTIGRGSEDVLIPMTTRMLEDGTYELGPALSLTSGEYAMVYGLGKSFTFHIATD